MLMIPVVMFIVHLSMGVRRYNDSEIDAIMIGLTWPVTSPIIITIIILVALSRFLQNKAKMLTVFYNKMVYNSMSRTKDDTDDEDVLA
jgi:hypothetical protein